VVCEGLEARLTLIADGERRLSKLEELPALVEEYLKDLPYLVGRIPVIREYETIGAERTPENPLGIYTLTSERIRCPPEVEVAARRRTAEAARFRKLYAMLGIRAAVHADGNLEITVGATNTKGVMPCDGSD
jgi:hypothetical protein